MDDAAEFETTQRALSTVGLSLQLQWQIFRLLAALVHVGNIQITGRGDAAVADTDNALVTSTRLLGIKAADFKKWIIRKQIITRSEKIVTNLKPDQAVVVRDSVAKYIYANLFDWLVAVINESLISPDQDAIQTFIGVLDIYGFEHFKKNSFEQFCINYANEKLQQQVKRNITIAMRGSNFVHSSSINMSSSWSKKNTLEKRSIGHLSISATINHVSI